MDELTLGMTIEKQNSNLEELRTKVGALEEELIQHREVGNDNVDKVNDFMKKMKKEIRLLMPSSFLTSSVSS